MTQFKQQSVFFIVLIYDRVLINSASNTKKCITIYNVTFIIKYSSQVSTYLTAF